jgi:hypothetical protein
MTAVPATLDELRDWRSRPPWLLTVVLPKLSGSRADDSPEPA